MSGHKSLKTTAKYLGEDSNVIVWVNDAPFARKGDVSIIKSKKKLSATQLGAFLLASPFKKLEHSLGILSAPCPENACVIFIDTRSSLPSRKRLRGKTLKLTGFSQLPGCISIISTLGLEENQRKEFIEQLLENKSQIHLIVIDDIGDLGGAEDSLGAKELLTWLKKMAEKHETAVIAIFSEHSNKEIRGHLGSETVRNIGNIPVLLKYNHENKLILTKIR